VVGGAASSDLRERGAEAIGKIQLEEMSSGALLDAEAALIGARSVPRRTRREFADQVHGRSNPHSRAETDDEGVVVRDDLLWELVGVVDPDRLDIESRDMNN